MKRKVYEKPEIGIVEIQCDNMILAGSGGDDTQSYKVQIGGSTLTHSNGDPDDID